MVDIKGNVVDVINERAFPGIVRIENGKIKEIKEVKKYFRSFILPGLVDAHIHIESSMLTPSMFAEAVIPHGTVAVVSDPHEIANVLGMKGIYYMIEDAKQSPLKTFFTAPSCVPATRYETSGAILGAKEIEELMKHDKIVALGEMMNFHGVVNDDKNVMKKIEIAKRYGKPIDGHCPGLRGGDLKKYFEAGISTDHECVTLEEAREKAKLGMKIMIREGSSAKNMEALIDLAKEGYECFLVSDDKHPEDLLKGHVNFLLKKAVSLGIEPIKAIKMVSLNPVKHYNLHVGLLRVGDPADFIVVKDLVDFSVLETWINGSLVGKDGESLFKAKPKELESSFRLDEKTEKAFEIRAGVEEARKVEEVRVIKVVEGQIITKEMKAELEIRDGKIQTDIEKDILKIAVVERYGHNRIGLGFVHGFGFTKGAIASSVAHDSHNIIVVGADDKDMAMAVNTIKEMNGGLIAVTDQEVLAKVSLPIAGLMSTKKIKDVNDELRKIHDIVEKIGCSLKSPFMTMSFLALLVIPELKISDFGLFDVNKFELTDLAVES